MILIPERRRDQKMKSKVSGLIIVAKRCVLKECEILSGGERKRRRSYDLTDKHKPLDTNESPQLRNVF